MLFRSQDTMQASQTPVIITTIIVGLLLGLFVYAIMPNAPEVQDVPTANEIANAISATITIPTAEEIAAEVNEIGRASCRERV